MIKTARLYLFPLLLTIFLFADNPRAEAFYANNEIDIYDISSHKGLQGSLDTRLLSKDGWMSIAEDMLKSNMILNTIKLIATTEKVGVQDFFKETDKSNKTYEAVKRKVAEDPKLAAALQSPKLTPQQKEEMLNGVTGAVMAALGYKTHKNVIVATNATGRDNKQVMGYFSTETGNAYINDKNIADTNGLVSTAGYESTRAMDQQDGVDFNSNREDRSAYATIFGDNLATYTDFALDINGYDGGLATTNNHVGSNTNYVTANNNTFASLDKNQGDNRQLHVKEMSWITANAQKYADMHPGMTKAEAIKVLSQTAASIVDASWAKQEHIQQTVNSDQAVGAEEFLMSATGTFDDGQGNADHGYFAATDVERANERQYIFGGADNPLAANSAYRFNKNNLEGKLGVGNVTDPAKLTAGAIVGVGEVAVDSFKETVALYDLVTDQQKLEEASAQIKKMLKEGTLIETVFEGMKDDAKQVLIDKVVADLYDDPYNEGKADIKILMGVAAVGTGVVGLAKTGLKVADKIKDATVKQALKNGTPDFDVADVKPTPQNGPLTNPSGSTTDMANAARTQPYGNVEKIKNNGTASQENKPDFYVGPSGPNSTLPSTGYRYMTYMDADGAINQYAQDTIKTQEVRLSYFGFEKLNTGDQVIDAFQIRAPKHVTLNDPDPAWSDGRLRFEFDTLQLYENGKPNVSVPYSFGGTGLDLEPFTTTYPEYGKGGIQQLVPSKTVNINANKVDILPEK